MSDRRVVLVIRLPQIRPAFAEDQRWRDGCMLPSITWFKRILRQLFPRYDSADCCYYHRQDLHAVADFAVSLHAEVESGALDAEGVDDLIDRRLDDSRLSEDERSTVRELLLEGCGIQLVRYQGERRWHYEDGRHRAHAFMDAGVRRIVVSSLDERRC